MKPVRNIEGYLKSLEQEIQFANENIQALSHAIMEAELDEDFDREQQLKVGLLLEIVAKSEAELHLFSIQ